MVEHRSTEPGAAGSNSAVLVFCVFYCLCVLRAERLQHSSGIYIPGVRYTDILIVLR